MGLGWVWMDPWAKWSIEHLTVLIIYCVLPETRFVRTPNIDILDAPVKSAHGDQEAKLDEAMHWWCINFWWGSKDDMYAKHFYRYTWGPGWPRGLVRVIVMYLYVETQRQVKSAHTETKRQYSRSKPHCVLITQLVMYLSIVIHSDVFIFSNTQQWCIYIWGPVDGTAIKSTHSPTTQYNGCRWQRG